MLQLRCTAKLRSFLAIKDADLEPPRPNASVLGAWYANVFALERRRALIFMSERTLLSFIVHGARKDNTRNLGEVLRFGLGQVLAQAQLPAQLIQRAIDETQGCQYTKTNSAQVLGNLTDLVKYYRHCIAYEGGMAPCNLSSIISDANRMPQRTIGWEFSIDLTRALLQQDGSAH